MSRSFKMSNDVYTAMLARGFGGEMRAYSAYRDAAGRLAGPRRCASRCSRSRPLSAWRSADGPLRSVASRAGAALPPRGRPLRLPQRTAGRPRRHRPRHPPPASRWPCSGRTAAGSRPSSSSSTGSSRPPTGAMRALGLGRRGRRRGHRRVPLPPGRRPRLPGSGHPAVQRDGLRRRRVRAAPARDAERGGQGALRRGAGRDGDRPPCRPGAVRALGRREEAGRDRVGALAAAGGRSSSTSRRRRSTRARSGSS